MIARKGCVKSAESQESCLIRRPLCLACSISEQTTVDERTNGPRLKRRAHEWLAQLIFYPPSLPSREWPERLKHLCIAVVAVPKQSAERRGGKTSPSTPRRYENLSEPTTSAQKNGEMNCANTKEEKHVARRMLLPWMMDGHPHWVQITPFGRDLRTLQTFIIKVTPISE